MATKKRFHGAPKKNIISEDRTAIANMPKDVVYRSWGYMPTLDGARLDDTMAGIDDQLWDNLHKIDRNRRNRS